MLLARARSTQQEVITDTQPQPCAALNAMSVVLVRYQPLEPVNERC